MIRTLLIITKISIGLTFLAHAKVVYGLVI